MSPKPKHSPPPNPDHDSARNLLSISRVKKRRVTKTTFRMTSEGYDALNQVARLLRMNVGELIDLISDHHVQKVANYCSQVEINGQPVRRSYTLKQETLPKLRKLKESVAQVTGRKVSRDDIVESFVVSIWRSCEAETEKEKERLREAHELFREFTLEFSRCARKIGELFADDPDHVIHTRVNYIDMFIGDFDSALQDAVEHDIEIPDRYA